MKLRDAVHPGDADRRRWPSPPPRVLLDERGRRYQTAARTACREVLYNFASAANNNGSAFAYQGTGHRLVHGHPGHRDADRALLPDHPGAGDRRLAGRASRRCRRRPARCRPHTPAVRRSRRRRHRHRRRPDVLPGPRAGPDPRTPLAAERGHRHDCNAVPEPMPDRRPRPDAAAAEGAAPAVGDALDLRSGASSGRRRSTRSSKLNPRTMVRNPVMFIVEVGSVLTTILFVRDFGDSDAQRERVRRARRRVGCGSPCCSPTSPRRWPKGAARPRPRRCARPAADTDRHASAAPTARSRSVPSSAAAGRRPVRRHRRRGDPRRRRHRRGHRHRRRVGDHRRVGAGHPRVRRRPLGGHRRHPGAVSDEIVVRITAKPGETFLDRMIALVEGADRQKTPNEIALSILLAGLTIIFLLAVVTLQPFAIYSGAEQNDHRARRPAGLPDPDDDRRAAVGDRHRRHGPPRAAQRAGDVRPRRRGGRRRDDAAARQDRHDHVRRPARRPSSSRSPASTEARGRRGARWPRRSPTRRRKGARSSTSPSHEFGLDEPSTTRGAVLVPFTAQTRMSGMDFDRRAGSVRKGAADSVRRFVRGRGRRRAARARPDRRQVSQRRRHAARRHRPQAAPGDLAGARRRSGSRTPSSRACASASTSCGRWASAR